jgi:hypothetical protein
MSSESIFSFNAETGKCVVYGRGPVENEVWTTTKLTFAEAHDLANLVQRIYTEGYERGAREQGDAVRSALRRSAGHE